MRKIPTWLPYVLPLVLFLILTSFQMSFGVSHYPLTYTATIVIVAFVLILFRRSGAYPELQPSWRYLPLAVLLGIALCAVWVGVDQFTPHFKFLGSRAGFDPWAAIPDSNARIAFILIRFIGLVAVVPIMEELFYRSFLLRFIIDPNDFQRVPIGKYETTSCIAVVALMALSHPEWLAAAIFSLATNLLIYRTKSVFACILTHGATNLALGIFVIATHTWRYW